LLADVGQYNRNHKKKKDLMEAYNWYDLVLDASDIADILTGATTPSSIPQLQATESRTRQPSSCSGQKTSRASRRHYTITMPNY
jgi:hypothetical protein